jgi:hypothetical protein
VILIGKTLGKKIDEKFWAKTVSECGRYRFLGFGGTRITVTVYHTGHLDCSCLFIEVNKATGRAMSFPTFMCNSYPLSKSDFKMYSSHLKLILNVCRVAKGILNKRYGNVLQNFFATAGYKNIEVVL